MGDSPVYNRWASEPLSLKLPEFLCYSDSLTTKNLLGNKINYGSHSSCCIEIYNSLTILDISRQPQHEHEKPLSLNYHINVEH